MAISYEEVRDLLAQLQERDERRHRELAALRRYWQGDYWKDTDGRAGAQSVADLFRDLRGTADIGPDLKLIHNLLQEACTKYQAFLTPVPSARTFTDPPFSEVSRKQATLKERVIYGTWWANQMARKMAHIGWYLPLMGNAFLGAWPDFKQGRVCMYLKSPEHAHPVRALDGDGLDVVIFRQEVPEWQIKRAYPQYHSPDTQDPSRRFRLPGFVGGANAGGPRKVEIIEFSDKNEVAKFVGETKVGGIVHGFGRNLWLQVPFIPVPDENFDHGAVEQIVNLVEMGNIMLSLVMQSAFENAFPMLKIIKPGAAPEQIIKGPGAVLPLNEGGDAEYMTPPVQATAFQQAFLRDNADRILEGSGIPRVSMGQSPATSIVTGAAVDSLQGAGTGSTVEMVQGAGIGPELARWNELALFMYRTLFPDTNIHLYGYSQSSILDINPRLFSTSFKGSQIVGSLRNEVVFQPHVSDHDKLVMLLQARGDNLVSRKYARENALGIVDNDAMVEEIIGEQVEDGVLGAILQEFQTQPTPDGAARAEQEAITFIEGGPAAAPHPLLSTGLGANGTPPALPPGVSPAGLGPGGPGAAPNGPGPAGPPPGAPPPAAGPQQPPAAAAAPQQQPAAQSQSAVVTLDQATAAFQAVQGIKGRVFLVGQIVVRGRTNGPIEVSLTQQPDQKTLTQALPQYQGRLVFHPVTDTPSERYVEVTPGGPATPGGAEQTTPEALQGVFVQ